MIGIGSFQICIENILDLGWRGLILGGGFVLGGFCIGGKGLIRNSDHSSFKVSY